MVQLFEGDCLEEMVRIPAKSVDLILADLPYGQTKNPWDKVIPFEALWRQYKRVLSTKGAIVLFGQGIFSAKLILSNPKMYKYTLIWEKTTPTGFYNAKIAPLRSHEDILVFYDKAPTYNPQKTTGNKRVVSSAKHKRNCNRSTNYGNTTLTDYDSTERYPKSVWRFATDRQTLALHPTQKPIALIQELIRTYSNAGDTVLDNTMGSGTTGGSER